MVIIVAVLVQRRKKKSSQKMEEKLELKQEKELEYVRNVVINAYRKSNKFVSHASLIIPVENRLSIELKSINEVTVLSRLGGGSFGTV